MSDSAATLAILPNLCNQLHSRLTSLWYLLDQSNAKSDWSPVAADPAFRAYLGGVRDALRLSNYIWRHSLRLPSISPAGLEGVAFNLTVRTQQWTKEGIFTIYEGTGRAWITGKLTDEEAVPIPLDGAILTARVAPQFRQSWINEHWAILPHLELLEAYIAGGTLKATSETESAAAASNATDRESAAVMLMMNNPGWTNKAYIEAAGWNKSSFYRSPRIKSIIKAKKTNRRIPKGSKVGGIVEAELDE